MEESEGEIFWAYVSLFFALLIVPIAQLSIQIFCKSHAMFFAFAES